MIFALVKSVAKKASCLIFPPRCPLCSILSDKDDESCPVCEQRIVRISADAYFNLPWRVWIAHARSCFAHEDPIRRALWSFKYEGELHSLNFFVAALADVQRRMGTYDFITAVPMQRMRVVKRGVNAAGLLARKLARRSRLCFCPGLVVRVKSVRTQVGLARGEREDNVRGAFAAGKNLRSIVEGRSVLIVDDVMTTGATINECGRVLIASGASRVDALTVARAI